MPETKIYDIVIIGGGIVGMATAMELSLSRKHSILVIEKENRLAAHQTGNNSGVIHSGLYYKPGSLKATNCTIGREQIYEFCELHNIPHERCGKVVVALSQDEIPALEKLEERGAANGIKGIKRLEPSQIKEIEPNISGIKGLFIPETGIVDYTKVVEKYAEIFKTNGGEIKLNSKVTKIKVNPSEIILHTANDEDITCKNLVNCAGLHSDRIAKMAGVDPQLKIIPFRGEYYKLAEDKEHLIKNLVYPVPDPRFPFLGVHFTRMKRGGVEAGPNAVLAFKREGYKKLDFSLTDNMELLFYKGFWKMAFKFWKMGIGEMHRSFSKTAFTKALQKLLPVIEKKDLAQGGAGIRAQALEPDGFLVDDFRIREAKNMVHVLNAPSPAATASINIGKSIAAIALKNFNS